jgi:adenylate cyclase class 2
MTSAVETEIKFRIQDASRLGAGLRKAGFHPVTPRTHELNTLYDLPGRPLRKAGSLLRLRKYGDHWLLTFKGKATLTRYKSRKEIETEVADGNSLSQILASIGFVPVFSYEKFRSEWSDDRGHVLIDETPIGNFGEIEGPGEWIDATARRLQITPDHYITDSYAVLFLKWKRRTHSKAKNMCFADVG